MGLGRLRNTKVWSILPASSRNLSDFVYPYTHNQHTTKHVTSFRVDAAEAFTKAANSYKLESQYTQAGNACMRAAEAYEKADSGANDTINATVEAGNCFKMGNDHGEAVKCFQKAIEAYEESQRFGQCAKYQKEVAEIYEACQDFDSALQCFQKAAHYYTVDNKKSQANQITLKLATMLTTHSDKYIEAADIFEKTGTESLESRLGQYSAKGHFFQCLLCHLAAGDNVQVRNKIESFKNKDHSFANCRECKFIEKIVESLENFDADMFAQACQEFDQITPLDPWKVSLLSKAKTQIGDTAAGEEEVDLT